MIYSFMLWKRWVTETQKRLLSLLLSWGHFPERCTNGMVGNAKRQPVACFMSGSGFWCQLTSGRHNSTSGYRCSVDGWQQRGLGFFFSLVIKRRFLSLKASCRDSLWLEQWSVWVDEIVTPENLYSCECTLIILLLFSIKAQLVAAVILY